MMRRNYEQSSGISNAYKSLSTTTKPLFPTIGSLILILIFNVQGCEEIGVQAEDH